MNYKKATTHLVIIFVLLLGYHLFLNITYSGYETAFNRWVVPVMALVMLYGSFFGFRGIKRMSISNAQSKGLLFASISTLFLGFGFLVWAYYAIFLDNDLPFPSFADYLWLLYTIFNIIAFFYFFKIFKSSINARKIITAIVFLLIVGYIVIQLVGVPMWGGEDGVGLNETFFNFFYSVSDLILIVMSIIILTVAGGKIFSGLFIYNLGLIVMVAADLVFAFRETAEVYWQGDISDVLFSIAGFLFSLGIIMFVRKLSTISDQSYIENNQ